MKKLTDKASNDPVTEKFLVEKLKAYVTKLDLKTEIAFQNIEIDEKLTKLDVKNRGYKDELMTKLDKVLKELVDMREENDASTLRFERNETRLDNHGKRITTLETAKN